MNSHDSTVVNESEDHMVYNITYKIGNVIEQEFCDGHTRLVQVERRTSNIKNDLPGFDGIEIDANGNPVESPFGAGVWGYDYQVKRVVQ